MAVAEPIAEDGNLPEARRELGNAISTLIDPKPHHDNETDTTRWVESLYIQLIEEVPGQQGTGHGVPRSIPPLCLDAADLLNEIDTAVACWEPRPQLDASNDNPPPITVIRLTTIEKRRWRPQDVNGINQIISNINSWVASIKQLLTPQRHWTLPNPCPACDTAVVYRKDSAGELVRQPALQIGPNGCECQRCHNKWAPEYFSHLARTLGYQLPPGVLE